MLSERIFIAGSLLSVLILGSSFVPKTVEISLAQASADAAPIDTLLSASNATATSTVVTFDTIAATQPVKARSLRAVPFYSQFADISSPEWKKVSCGIASLGMLIKYYRPDTEMTLDALLTRGIAAGAYVDDAGWSHAGLISLAGRYGLTGESRSLADLTMQDAFAELEQAVAEGPVMVSVHYTFEPSNPIPHLVVITNIKDDKVYYNDPAEKAGNGSISKIKFQNSWKKRYIAIRPQ